MSMCGGGLGAGDTCAHPHPYLDDLVRVLVHGAHLNHLILLFVPEDPKVPDDVYTTAVQGIQG